MVEKHTALLAALIVVVGGMPTALGSSEVTETTDSDGEMIQRVAANDVAQQQNTSVTFENQTSNGTTVTVTQTNLSDGGFVVIHDRSLLNGSVLNSIIGVSAYLEPGTHENVTVALNESIDESQQLLALAYRDTNADQEFDFVASQGASDGPYTVNNQVIGDDATVVVEELTETTADEETTPAPDETTTEQTTERTTAEATTTEETTATEETTTTAGEPTTDVTTTPETTTSEATTTTTAETTTEETTTDTETTSQETTTEEPSLRVTSLEVPNTIALNESSLIVEATLENPSERTLTESVQLRVDGTVVAEQERELEAGETGSIQFEVDKTEIGLERGETFLGVLTRDYGQVIIVTVTDSQETESTTTTD